MGWFENLLFSSPNYKGELLANRGWYGQCKYGPLHLSKEYRKDPNVNLCCLWVNIFQYQVVLVYKTGPGKDFYGDDTGLHLYTNR